MNRCSGCGAILQSLDQEQIGYIRKEKLKTNALCERCFRLIHYNDLKLVTLPKENILETINRKNNLVFFLIDLLNINKEVLETYHKIRVPKVLIVSKIDYIPKYMKKEKIKLWLQEEYNVEDDIFFLSASRNVNTNSIVHSMKKRNQKMAYLLGYTNAGKSTLLNCLKEENNITTSIAPNTTLDYIKVSLPDGYQLIDSSGFEYNNPIYKDNLSLLKKMSPKSFLKPLTYQLKKGTSLVIEKMIRIENESNRSNLTLYISNLLEIKKVYENSETLKEKKKMTLAISDAKDIVIQGIGFLNVKKKCILSFYIENPNWIEVRSSFFER